jgi:ethanolamine utilization protein EutQ (cupin superfamily)
VAIMQSPAGWSEPGQTPAFDEFTVVIEGEVLVETKGETFTAVAGQAIHARANEWVRYSTTERGARYVAVCLPAFAPDRVHRDRANDVA